jgi:hypothetical protein
MLGSKFLESCFDAWEKAYLFPKQIQAGNDGGL